MRPLNETVVTGLTNSDQELIISAAKQFQQIEKLVLFGSRAKNTFKKGSDVDLVLLGSSVSSQIAIELAILLNEELPLPYFFDVISYNDIQEPKLMAHIQNVGVILYSSEGVINVSVA